MPYKLYTLFDITATQVIRPADINSIPRNQQRNWETIIQILSLRTQPDDFVGPTVIVNAPLKNYNFGKNFKGRAAVWQVEFTVEYPQVFVIADDPIGYLMQDANLVPMVNNLTETATFNVSCIKTLGPDCNTYFEFHKT
jgi:hypothetical protein